MIGLLEEVIVMLDKRELERKILGGIDRLVHILIDISCTAGRPKEMLMEQASQMVRDLSPLLLNLLGGQEEHLEGLLRQLISQKLPPRLALLSFGSLKGDLDRILAMAFFKESENEPEILESQSPAEQDPTPPEEKQIPADSLNEQVIEQIEQVDEQTIADSVPVATTLEEKQASEALPDLTPFLQRLFPRATILPGCYYRSIFLDYYLPEEKFALCIMQPGRRIIPSLERLIKNEGLTLIKVKTSELNDPQILTQRLKST